MKDMNEVVVLRTDTQAMDDVHAAQPLRMPQTSRHRFRLGLGLAIAFATLVLLADLKSFKDEVSSEREDLAGDDFRELLGNLLSQAGQSGVIKGPPRSGLGQRGKAGSREVNQFC
jgi:hypothetical protein